jgi:histidinol phosphatase-like PHP family hydrolase
MSWIPVDCHAHTTMSDGTLTVAQLVERARQQGVRPSVADHVTREVTAAIDTTEKLDAYLAELARHDVLRGAEFCWHDWFWRELPAATLDRFTHRIGSLHALPLADGNHVHAFARQVPDGMTRHDYMALHLATTRQLATDMPVDILGHPTLVSYPFRDMPAEELWTEQHEEAMLSALLDAGIAFEVSNRYRPHDRIVARAITMGLRISLGSDGHRPHQVADIAWPLDTVRRLGARDEDLYDPARHGSRRMEAA